MQQFATFDELAVHFGLWRQAEPQTYIPAWEERYFKRIERMFNAVRKFMIPIWDDEWESFIIERPTPSGFSLRRLLWSEGEQWVFGDEDGREYASSTSLTEIIGKIKKWSNAKFIKK